MASMASSPYFTSMHHKDIYGYYRALQSFFEVTEAKHDRSNSPRAQKARAKLLKLSASQFYELSTDVYDELQRRINEDQSQPEYLLPKASFHIKRNQARQKLANLSQTRFNDLVDDILYEIKRRGYDSYKVQSEEQAAHIQTGNGISKDASKTAVSATATIQTSQVIPKKASIDWSSDEEEGDKHIKLNTDITDTSTTDTKSPFSEGFKSYAIASDEIKGSNSSFHSGSSQIATPVTKTVSDNYQLLSFNGTPQREGKNKIESDIDCEDDHSKMPKQSNSDTPANHDTAGNRDTTTTRDTSGKITGGNIPTIPQKTVVATYGTTSTDKDLTAKLEALNSKLEEREREITELKNEALAGNGDSNKTESNVSYQRELSSLSSQVSTLSIENEKLKQQLSEIEFRSRHSSCAKTEGIASVGALHLLDGIRENYPLDEKSISKYISDEGSVPLDSVVKINSLIIVLYATLQYEKENIGKELFENISKLSDSISQLLVFVNTPEFKEDVVLLKASLSHTITAVRYYSVFTALLPKVTVQAAIAELAFSICNLLGSCKIKHRNNDEKSAKTKKDDEKLLQPLPQYPAIKNNKNLTPEEVPTIPADHVDEMSPVRPLKITQRANMSPSSTPPSSRKPSGNLLFSMIDRKSPLSSAHSSKINFKLPIPTTKGEPDKSRIQTGSSKGLPNKEASNNLHFDPNTPDKAENGKSFAIEHPTDSSVSALPDQVDGPVDSSKDTPIDTPSKVQEKNSKTSLSSLSAPSTAVADTKSESLKALSNNQPNSPPTESHEESTPALPGRSFTEKLNSFTNSAGIGLRVDKGLHNTNKTMNATEPTTKPLGNTLGKENTYNRLGQNKAPPLITVTKNTSPSKLTDKLRQTFQHMSNDESDEDNDGSSNNDSSDDDNEAYMQLKKSLKKDNPIVESRDITKTTEFPPVDKPSVHFSGKRKSSSETTADDLNSRPYSASEKEKLTNEVTSDDLNSQPNFVSEKVKDVITSPIKPAKEKDLAGDKANASSLQQFEDDIKKKNQNQVNYSDDYSDYQFVPLKQEASEEMPPDIANRKRNELNEPLAVYSQAGGDAEENSEENGDADVDFDFDRFDIENPDNTLSELLLYLEHQTVEVISTIQSLLSSIKEPHATKGDLRVESNAINQVVCQMVGATSVSMNQSRNASLKEHGNWVVKSLEDCSLRMLRLCQLNHAGSMSPIKGDEDYADKNFKQRLAGIAFDVAKCTKELVKTVEEASLKEEIAFLNSRLN